jgi:hypothetical protein
MSELRTYRIFAVILALAWIASACGTAQPPDSVISTAVAQTVQAGQGLTTTPNVSTPNPATPSLDLTLTPAADAAVTPTNPPTLVSAPPDPNCVKASLVAENPPDKTIMTPGQYFWKTWSLQNTGTCTWTTAYSLVFWNGDRLGSSLSYPLPDDIAPGETKDITIYLQAPDTGGSFTGFWRIKTPWESNFGVGQYDTSISTSIVVGSITPESRRTDTVFGVTSVTYKVDRTCTSANTFYTITAFITSSGPVKVDFMWIQSDGNNDETNSVTFAQAATKAVTREWSQHKETSTNPRWAQVIVTSPTYQEFDKVPLPDFCYFKP